MNWAIIDAVVGVIAGVAGIASIFTSSKAADYNDQQMYKKLEEKYKLEANDKKES